MLAVSHSDRGSESITGHPSAVGERDIERLLILSASEDSDTFGKLNARGLSHSEECEIFIYAINAHNSAELIIEIVTGNADRLINRNLAVRFVIIGVIPAFGLIILVIGINTLGIYRGGRAEKIRVNIKRLGKRRNRHSDLRGRSGTVLSHQRAVGVDLTRIVDELREIAVEGRKVEGRIRGDRKYLATLRRLNHDSTRITILAVEIARDRCGAVNDILNIIRKRILCRHLQIYIYRQINVLARHRLLRYLTADGITVFVLGDGHFAVDTAEVFLKRKLAAADADLCRHRIAEGGIIFGILCKNTADSAENVRGISGEIVFAGIADLKIGTANAKLTDRSNGRHIDVFRKNVGFNRRKAHRLHLVADTDKLCHFLGGIFRISFRIEHREFLRNRLREIGRENVAIELIFAYDAAKARLDGRVLQDDRIVRDIGISSLHRAFVFGSVGRIADDGKNGENILILLGLCPCHRRIIVYQGIIILVTDELYTVSVVDFAAHRADGDLAPCIFLVADILSISVNGVYPERGDGIDRTNQQKRRRNDEISVKKFVSSVFAAALLSFLMKPIVHTVLLSSRIIS